MLDALLMLWVLGSLPPAPAIAADIAVARLWNRQRVPAPGPPQAIGAYAAGCLQGAEALPASGPGYETLRRSRRRYFGHPDLIAFIARLGVAAEAQHLPWVAIGDLSQARGGPTPSGHRSHQSGLDVDVAYAPPAKMRGNHLQTADREHPRLPAVVDLRTNQLTSSWNRRIVRLLAIAAGDSAVERIFVHPAVRRALCAGPERQAPWLVRLRPWWGHHDHFHVRLKCPAASPLCEPQEPATIEPDEGCGASLDWWFNRASDSARARRNTTEASQRPALPSACAGLLSSPPPSPARVAQPAASYGPTKQ